MFNLKKSKNIFVIFIFVIFSLKIFAFDIIDEEIEIGKIRKKYRNYILENYYNYDKRDEIFDVKFYDISIDVNFDAESISGVVKIGFKSLINNLNSIEIDLYHNMNVVSVKTINNVNLNFNHTGNIINIFLDQNLNIGEYKEILITYNGIPTSEGSFQSLAFDTHGYNNTPLVSTLSEPYGAKTWWPCKDNVSDKADSVNLHITVPSQYKVASNGILTSVTINGNKKTYHWKHKYPITTYLVAFAATNYTEFTQYWKYSNTDSMLIQNFVFPEHYNSSQTTWRKLPQMLDCYTYYFGLYPFIAEKYGMAEFLWGGAMEHQTMTFITGGYSGGFSEETIAHELAHQWFGNKITCSDWHNLFINEGFATYSQALYVEFLSGLQAYHDYIQWFVEYSKNAQYPVYIQNVDNINILFDYKTTYAKGATILHMLRGVMGDSAFFQAIRNFQNNPQFAYKNASINDFLNECEYILGENLDYFYTEWFTRVGYPHYNVSTEVYPDFVLVHVNQSAPHYIMPIQLKIIYNDGTFDITRVFNDQQNQNFEIPLTKNKSVTQVILDPNNWIQKSVTYQSVGIENQAFYFDLKDNYPNPFNPITKIEYSLSKNVNDLKLLVYNIKGELVKTLLDNRISSINNYKNSGKHQIIWDGKDNYGKECSSGIYFYKLIVDGKEKSKKMVLVK